MTVRLPSFAEQRVRSGSAQRPPSKEPVRRLRVLHAVLRMNRAGVETWLMHVLRRIDRERFQMDFLVHSDEPGDYDAEIQSLGSNILCGARLREAWKYGDAVTRLLRDLPQYDIMHSHLDYFSGQPLKCAEQLGIPIRIAHSHNDLARSFTHLRWSHKLYARWSKSLIARHRTFGLAASVTAGESLFGKRPSDGSWSVFPCAIDVAPYAPSELRADIRQEFRIPEDAVVIGHVGRFAEQKNHKLILDIAEAILRRTDKFHLLLVGRGPLQPRIEREIQRRGLTAHVTIAGVRADVPRLFTSLFDVFLFPSLFEGLGLVVVEAQAAGCPAVISDVVPPEADVVSRLITRVPLTARAQHWADAVLHAAREPQTPVARAAAYEAVAGSPFNISACHKNLENLYVHLHSRRKAA